MIDEPGEERYKRGSKGARLGPQKEAAAEIVSRAEEKKAGEKSEMNRRERDEKTMTVVCVCAFAGLRYVAGWKFARVSERVDTSTIRIVASWKQHSVSDVLPRYMCVHVGGLCFSCIYVSCRLV